MFTAALRALDDVLSAEFRSVLFTAIGLTILLFGVTIAGTVMVLQAIRLVPWEWAETLIEVVASLGIVVLAVFLMAPVSAFFAGFFLDRVAGLVERRHYPLDPPGRELPFARAIVIAVQFGLLVLALNILLLPSFFFGIGAITMIIANAYLLSREYFEMAAMRHMAVADARQMRKANSPQIFFAGLLPALLAIVPVVNIVVPLFATSYFVHIFKRVRASSA
jgi:CysZ protein